MGKVEENKKRKREALLNAAFSLFTSQGVYRTSISDIAKKADIAKGTFYRYFSDKYDIRDQLIISKATQLFYHATQEMKEKGICRRDAGMRMRPADISWPPRMGMHCGIV